MDPHTDTGTPDRERSGPVGDAGMVEATPDSPAVPVAESKRIASIDVIRGFALLGILVMNLPFFALSTAMFFHPPAAGGFEGADYATWLGSHLLFEMKLMSIFSMLFGAGVVLFAEKAVAKRGRAAGLHYRRMWWLLVFGLVHAYLVWEGDILFSYAVMGMLVFPLRHVPPRWLVVIAVGLGVIAPIVSTGQGFLFAHMRDQAAEHERLVAAGEEVPQSVENWAMMIPGLKVVAPSTPRDIVGLLAAAVRDPDHVVFFEHKSLMADKAEVPAGELVDTLGTARVVRQGADATVVALALMVPRALAAAEQLASSGISVEVIDVRSLVPLDTATIIESVEKTGRLFTVEENPRLCGWGAEIVSIVDEEAFWSLDGPSVRVTTPHIPLPAAASLEDLALPSVERIADTIAKSVDAGTLRA